MPETIITNKQLFFAPRADLAGVVNNVMIGHLVTTGLTPGMSFPFPPLPEHCILFYPFDRPQVEDALTKRSYRLFACTVTGQLTERTILTLGRNHLMIKIGFQPGALQRLLGEPMHNMLPYKSYDGEAVFGSCATQALDAFSIAPDFATMKGVADTFMSGLMHKVRKSGPIDRVIPEIIRQGGMAKIDRLVQLAYMSNRQFERNFKERMGVSPKFYSRLVRFGKAWLLKEGHPDLSWLAVAHECQYFDQMHLVRDFREFAGTNPRSIATAFETQPLRLEKKIFS